MSPFYKTILQLKLFSFQQFFNIANKSIQVQYIYISRPGSPLRLILYAGDHSPARLQAKRSGNGVRLGAFINNSL